MMPRRRGHERSDGPISQDGKPRSAAGYVNRGPVGYANPRERALQDVANALVRCPDLDVSELEVVAKDDDLLLRGRVASEPERQRALEIARRAAGHCRVESALVVAPLARSRHGR